MATAVYFLCAVTSGACAWALIREYFRRSTRLLLWSSLAFTCLSLSNALVFIDFVILPDRDLSAFRAATACAGVSLLVFGLVWDSE